MSKKYERKTPSARPSDQHRPEDGQPSHDLRRRLAVWVGGKFAGGVLAGVGRELVKLLVDALLSN